MPPGCLLDKHHPLYRTAACRCQACLCSSHVTRCGPCPLPTSHSVDSFSPQSVVRISLRHLPYLSSICAHSFFSSRSLCLPVCLSFLFVSQRSRVPLSQVLTVSILVPPDTSFKASHPQQPALPPESLTVSHSLRNMTTTCNDVGWLSNPSELCRR